MHGTDDYVDLKYGYNYVSLPDNHDFGNCPGTIGTDHCSAREMFRIIRTAACELVFIALCATKQLH